MNSNVTELSGVYPMRVVSRLTGLTADTIRVWERRYKAVQPERTDGNKRRYSGGQVRRLVLLRRATELGHSIGQVARLRDDDLRRIIGESTQDLPSGASLYDAIIDDYIRAVMSFDVHGAETILSRTAAIIPPMKFSLEVLVPLMGRIGEAWHEGDLRIHHEHIISGQLRNILGTLIRHVEPAVGAPRVIVATPPNHLHEFGAIIGAYMAASRGFEPIYLGANMPFEEMADAATQSHAAIVLMSVARDCNGPELKSLLAGIKEISRSHELWIGIPEGHALANAEPQARLLHRYNELDEALVAYKAS